MATKLLNSKFIVRIRFSYNYLQRVGMSFSFDNKNEMLRWIKKYQAVSASDVSSEYTITFERTDYFYDDTLKHITQTTTFLTAEDL